MRIICIAGTNGSGKDSLGEMLAGRHGWLFVSITDILRDGLRDQGLPIERENMRRLSADWRRESGLGVLIDKAVEEFKRRGGEAKYQGLVIASLRNPGEADEVHKLGGRVVWLDGDPKVRYGRIYSRQRSSEDQKTFEQFLAEEQAEMQHEGDEATLNMAGVKAQADIFIDNNFPDLQTFHAHIQKTLGLK